MKVLYVVGAGIVTVGVSAACYLAYCVNRQIEHVNEVLIEAEKILNAYHHNMMRRPAYRYGNVMERYELLLEFVKPKLDELLEKAPPPIRKTAESRVYNHAKKTVYRDLERG